MTTPHHIDGVAMSITASVGHTSGGVANRAALISSVADFERLFGGLAAERALSYGVRQFFANGEHGRGWFGS